ncbi:hypothetical protein DRQ53_00610 [bacterium]|nr:MAG: hypothetical protein DRQ53_00610 [bacterium]
MEFLSELPVGNLPVGAYLHWKYEDGNGLPVIQIRGDVKGGGFDMFADMSGLNSAGVELLLRNQGDLVAQISNYSGFWSASAGLPSAQRLLLQDGEVELWQGWTNGVSVTLDDQSVHLVDEIAIRSQTGGTVPEGFLKRVSLTSEMLPPIDVSRAGIQRFGMVMAGAKNLFYISEDHRMKLLLEDPEQPGEVILNSTNGLSILIAGYPPPWPPNSPPTMSYHFEDSANPAGPGFLLELADEGGPVSIKFDLTEQQTDSYDVVALLAGNVVDQYSASGSLVGSASGWTGSQGMEGNELVLRWPSPVTLDLPPGASAGRRGQVQADELRLQPVQPGALPDGHRVLMTLTGTQQFSITGNVVPTSAPGRSVGRLALHPNVPNPFNPSTQLQFTIANTGPVKLSIYDLRGRLVATLLDGWHEAGEDSVLWDGLDQQGHTVASGVYHAVLYADGEKRSRKISLVK